MSIESISAATMVEQSGQPSWASQGAKVSFDGYSSSLGILGFSGKDTSPAGIAEHEMSLKAQNRDWVSEPSAFDRYAGGRQEHWCAHFVSWLHAQAGQPLPDWKPPSPSHFPKHAGCPWLWSHLTKHGMTHNGMPQRNDIIFYKNSNPKYTSGHVGLVTKVENGKVTSIEGNLTPPKGRDTIAKVERSLDHSRILGYARAYQPSSRSAISGPLLGLGAFAVTVMLLKLKKPISFL